MASPRTSAPAPPPLSSEAREPKEGLSIQTLVIAAISSATAAIVVSHFWERGTVFASAMTPVVVAIVSELLKKPVESDLVRSGISNVSSISRPRSGRTPTVMAPPPRGADDPPAESGGGTERGPVRVYSSGSNKRPRTSGPPRNRFRLKVAVITGLIAFVIAAAALTLPELVFGGSVGGGGSKTTFFGGGSKSSDKDGSKDGESRDGEGDQPPGQPDPSEPQDPDSPVVPGNQNDQVPDQEQPAPTPESPSEPAPSTPPQTPQQPAPQTPPSGGTPTP